jgi:hypothetical protein
MNADTSVAIALGCSDWATGLIVSELKLGILSLRSPPPTARPSQTRCAEEWSSTSTARTSDPVVAEALAGREQSRLLLAVLSSSRVISRLMLWQRLWGRGSLFVLLVGVFMVAGVDRQRLAPSRTAS